MNLYFNLNICVTFLSYIKNNITFKPYRIELCDEAVVQLKRLFKTNKGEASTIVIILDELNNEPELEKILLSDGQHTKDYKIAYVRSFVKDGKYIWRLSINGELNDQEFSPLSIRLLYLADHTSKNFTVIDIMPRDKDYGNEDKEYIDQLFELYEKYRKPS